MGEIGRERERSQKGERGREKERERKRERQREREGERERKREKEGERKRERQRERESLRAITRVVSPIAYRSFVSQKVFSGRVFSFQAAFQSGTSACLFIVHMELGLGRDYGVNGHLGAN